MACTSTRRTPGDADWEDELSDRIPFGVTVSSGEHSDDQFHDHGYDYGSFLFGRSGLS